jgi:hypothetical protein
MYNDTLLAQDLLQDSCARLIKSEFPNEEIAIISACRTAIAGSGYRIMVPLLYVMKKYGKQLGLATLFSNLQSTRRIIAWPNQSYP